MGDVGLAAIIPRVVVEGSETGQFGGLPAVELSEFGQVGEHHGGSGQADPWNQTERLGFVLEWRMRGEVVFDLPFHLRHFPR